MYKLSDNYYLRKCFFKREQVPTQSQMINKMSPPLAKVYFKSMNSKLKVLAGLEPSLRGGGADWYMPPDEVLKGRYVLMPVKRAHLNKLTSDGVGMFGEHLVREHLRRQEEEKIRVLLESDINWKRTIEASCRQHWEDCSVRAATRNTKAIQQAFREFTNIYTTSFANLERLLQDASIKQVETLRDNTIDKMRNICDVKIKQQATTLYDIYEKKLLDEKARLKAEFINSIERCRTTMGDRIHDINVEKHVIVEKLRHFLQCQNLACQVYVAVKEREECKKELDLSEHEHKKEIKKVKEELALKDFEIRLAREKERKRHEFNKIWKRKVCEVVKKLQVFVCYCLNTLPEYAEFFMDMEKLMLIQLDDVYEDPDAESIFEPEEPAFHTPVPRPHPFYLVCDKGYKPHVDQQLCPKHCTSSASQLPVIVLNDRFVYSACDNFDLFTDKIKAFLRGQRGDDQDFADDHSYTFDIPVKYTEEQQIDEFKMQGSMLQLLQKDVPNLKGVPTECCLCKIPYCFCSPSKASKAISPTKPRTLVEEPAEISSGTKVDTRSAELIHEREPKWDSYFEYIAPNKCKCRAKAKHHLKEHLPAYMRNVSPFTAPELPNYETCSIDALRTLVKQAQNKPPPPTPPKKPPSRTRDIAIQYSDQEFDALCNCFSDEEIGKLLNKLMGSPESGRTKFKVLGDDISASYLSQRTSSFASDCAVELRTLLDTSPELEEIFTKKDCQFD